MRIMIFVKFLKIYLQIGHREKSRRHLSTQTSQSWCPHTVMTEGRTECMLNWKNFTATWNFQGITSLVQTAQSLMLSSKTKKTGSSLSETSGRVSISSATRELRCDSLNWALALALASSRSWLRVIFSGLYSEIPSSGSRKKYLVVPNHK